MTQYLPPNLLALFAPRDPIPYLPPTDKLPHEKTQGTYTGVSKYLNLFEDPKDTPPPTRVETREERIERKRREKAEQVAYKLEQDIALWDPYNNSAGTLDPFKTLFVARINYDTSESKLRREFEVFGPIKKTDTARVPRAVEKSGSGEVEQWKEKVEILREVDAGKQSKNEIAKKHDTPRSTLSTYIQNKKTIEDSYVAETFAKDRKRIRTAKHPDLEAALLTWIKEKRSQEIPLSGPIIVAKAADFALRVNVSDFAASDGWFHRFRDRHDLVFRSVCGEAKAVIVIVHNKITGKPRGYAFVEYEHERDMHSAYKHADGKKIDGRRVLVDVERGRTVKGWLPRRLGGGLGGTRRGGPDVNTKHSGREDSRMDERYMDRDGRDREDRMIRGGGVGGGGGVGVGERDRERERRRSRSRDRERRHRSRRRRERNGADRGVDGIKQEPSGGGGDQQQQQQDGFAEDSRSAGGPGGNYESSNAEGYNSGPDGGSGYNSESQSSFKMERTEEYN
ncbi:hypothetical protein HPB49_021454 [Dermacentor silvarum]|uniref:Uncharacterized protein n=1 Tax=Dermacentor silvarum TaxID=543639 RepID=A0ACB8CZP3_DERSI|nr:hypothetical protein HPB49_021454 [Dermacentor silvarum]